jgi:3-hydroxybutyryl-CoA dehydrogenase
MGAGIAEVFARAGFQAIGFEPDEAALERGRQNVRRSTGRAVQRGKLAAEAETELLGRIRFTTDLGDCAAGDLVVEAIPEQLPLKRDLFGRLDGVCRPETIFASNTSSLSITEIAASTGRPEKVLGMHFFNPAPVMRLVEVIRGVRTDPSTVDAIEKLAAQLGKTTVTVGDRAGFVVNALLLAYLNRAATLYETGYASAEDIDLAMKIGAGLPMGPLTLLDLIGLDTTVHVLNTMYAQSADRLHAPAPILRALVAAGFVGRKAGRGFYEYESPVPEVAPARPDVGEHNSVVLADVGDGPVLPQAIASGRPEDFVGLHPVGGGRLVEVVRTIVSSDRAVEIARAACGETPTVVAPDRPGFLVDALLLPHINDAIRMCESGYARAADIDTAMRLGCGYPAGPLEIATEIGLPRVLAGIEAIYADTREPGLAPAPLLTRLVAAGKSEFG